MRAHDLSSALGPLCWHARANKESGPEREKPAAKAFARLSHRPAQCAALIAPYGSGPAAAPDRPYPSGSLAVISMPKPARPT
jgi:hypothetical protein